MTARERRVLWVAILASFVAFLDGTVVNVALPAIAAEFAGEKLDGLALQQWVVDGYLITLGSLILVAGSVSDVYGRRRVLRWGLIGFLVTSIVCAIAPTGWFLVAARAAQGMAGALLVPSSLALIVATFREDSQGKAIGTWTAWTGTAMIIGPFVGGLLVDGVSWRWVFGINILPIAVTLWLLAGVDVVDQPTGRQIDLRGAVLAAVGLGGPVYALIEVGRLGVGHPAIVGTFWGGVACLILLIRHERRTRDPMLPLRLFRVRNFTAGNIATAAIYGALTLGGFMVTVFVQQVAGYSALQAGLAMLPVTLILLAFSQRAGAMASKWGPRVFMTLGPFVGGCGYVLLLTTTQEAHYVTQILPGMILFGIGLALTVAPLTTAILGAIPSADAGIGSAVNNAVARIAGLVTVACAGIIVGHVIDVASFHRSLLVTAGLLWVGAVVSWVGIRRPQAQKDEHL